MPQFEIISRAPPFPADFQPPSGAKGRAMRRDMWRAIISILATVFALTSAYIWNVGTTGVGTFNRNVCELIRRHFSDVPRDCRIDDWIIYLWGALAAAAIVYVVWQLGRLVYRFFRPKETKAPLQIIFDTTNPGRRYWSLESPRDENGNKKPGVFHEYRVEIKNNSSSTLRNVSATIEHIGPVPLRPTDAIFDKIGKASCDLKPGCSELVPIVRWPHPKIQAGMLAGPSAIAYGPIKVTASADDVAPTVRLFQFDYQVEPMLFDVRQSATQRSWRTERQG